jgi:hypothetical protein
MVNIIRILFCALACFFSITVYASNDPVRENFNKHVKNQEAYQMHTQRAAAEVRASISMTPEKIANVKQMLDKQGLLEDGSKVKIGASVTKPVDTAKVASTLVDRLKNAKSYAKNLGKASIPAFVGTAALHALMEGIGWVMDEGGDITRVDSNYNPDGSLSETNQYLCYYGSEPRRANTIYQCGLQFIQYSGVVYTDSTIESCSQQGGCRFKIPIGNGQYGFDNYQVMAGTIPRVDTFPTNDPIPVSADEIETALKNALESNNPALATAIAEAMKSAYTQDNSEGQPKTTNPLVADAQNDMQRAVDGALDTPTSTGGTAERPSGYYKITDGDKTIEGYVTPSDTSGQTNTDTESTTVTDSITGNQTTTGTSTGSIQFPAFCDWAGIVCDWIGWTKEEPEEPKYDQPVLTEVQIPYAPFSIASFNAQCPVDMNLSLDLMGQNQNFVLPMSPFCDFFSSIKPFVIALASFFAVRLLGNASFNSGN